MVARPRGRQRDGGRRANIEGATYTVLHITPHDGSHSTCLFDARGFPRRVVAAFGPQTYTTTYEDYRPVAGAMLPYRVRSESDTGNSSDAHAVEIHPNVPNIAEYLKKPVSDARDFSIANGATSTTVPFNLVDNHVYVNVLLDGKGPYRFVFDSGGATSSIPPC